MCRLLIYYGNPLVLSEIITKPTHSIITMAYDHYLPDIDHNWTLSKLRNHSRVNSVLNGDGFGVGWYVPSIELTPCIYTCASPPWNDRNLRRLVAKTVSNIAFCHVRAASPGSIVAESNCHPFEFGRFMWMHNGGVADFKRIRVKILSALSERGQGLIQGTTDTEHAGAYYTDQFDDLMGEYSPARMRLAMLRTIRFIVDLVNQHDLHGVSSLNFAVTDGKTIVCTRFRNHPTEQPPSLYWSQGMELKVTDGSTQLIPHTPRTQSKFDHHVLHGNRDSGQAHQLDLVKHAIVIASEPLTYERDNWTLVPKNSIIVIDEHYNMTIEPIHVGGKVDFAFQKWKRFTEKHKLFRKQRQQLLTSSSSTSTSTSTAAAASTSTSTGTGTSTSSSTTASSSSRA